MKDFIKNISSRLFKLMEATRSDFDPDKTVMQYSGELNFAQEDCVELEGIVEMVLGYKDAKDYYSNYFIKQKVMYMLSNRKILTDTQVSQEFGSFFEYLINHSFLNELMIFLPVSGLSFRKEDIDSIEIGDVKICKSEEMKKHLPSFLPKEGPLSQRTVSCVKVQAERFRAIEIARNRTSRAIGILSLYPSAEQNLWRHRLSVGVQNNYLRATVVNIETGGLVSGRATTPDEHYADMPLSSDVQKYLRKNHFDKIIENADNGHKFCKTILKGVSWYSTAMAQQNLSNSYLCLMIILELIFSDDSRFIGPTGVIAESTAIFLEKNYEKRRSTIKEIRDLYSERSKVVHHGSDNIDKSKHQKLQKYVRRVLLKTINLYDKFNSKGELIKEIKKVLYGGAESV